MNFPLCFARKFTILIFCLLLIAACAADAPAQHTNLPVNVDAARLDVVANALNLLGSPYQYGAAGPNRFDCSGLVNYSYRQAGLTVPRTTTRQLAVSTTIPLRELKPGDLLFFRTRRLWGTDHVGIYLGGHMFIHAPAGGSSVKKASLDSKYWRKRLYRAGSFLK